MKYPAILRNLLQRQPEAAREATPAVANGDFEALYAAKYRTVVANLLKRHGEADAMHQAVGGQFEAFGVLSAQILADHGLQLSDYLIDVGCGSGRVAHVLNVERYLGTDVVPELLEHARAICPNPRWRFELVRDISIPEQDAQADMVCFFSVFTHLLHEDSFRYLREARRVLKPGGKVVFSFLEFSIACHWPIFEGAVDGRARGDFREHTQFVSRDMINAWAQHCELSVDMIHNGDVPHIMPPYPLTLDDGRIITEMSCLGQSICVLRKAAPL